MNYFCQHHVLLLVVVHTAATRGAVRPAEDDVCRYSLWLERPLNKWHVLYVLFGTGGGVFHPLVAKVSITETNMCFLQI